MSAASFEAIKDRAHDFRAQKKWYRALSQRAAVCMVVAERPGLGCCLLMIQRAEHESDPWSGQMAFPGGKHDTDDAHITQTALREIHEEIAIPEEFLKRFGRLSDVLARPYRLSQKPMVISPILFETFEELSFQPNEEVADIVWVPIEYFRNPANRKSMAWKKNGIDMQLPCYDYQDKRIWGLSLLMIDELMQELV